MDWHYSPLILPLPIAGAISAALAILAWKRRNSPGAVPLVVLALAATVWTLGYAMELGSGAQATKILWAKFQYLGIVTAPTAWLAVTLQYTGRGNWLTSRGLILLAVVPLTVLLLVWTNEAHGLIWSDIRLDTSGSLSVLDITHGTAFWAYTLYSYGLLLLGSIFLADSLLHSLPPYWGQAGALLISVLAPWVASLAYGVGLSPAPLLDLTPFAFIISGLALGWALLRVRFLDLAPVARNTVFDNVNDGVLVLDTLGRVVDANPAVQQIFAGGAASVIGRPIDQVWPDGPALIESSDEVTPQHLEFSSGQGKKRRHFDVTAVPLHDGSGRLAGRLIVFHDITERHHAEAVLRHRDEELRNLSSMAIAAQEEERQWIAIELHDRVAQVISALSLQLQVLPASNGGGDLRHQAMEPVVALAKQAIAETRQIMNELYPTTLEDLGIAIVIQNNLRQLKRDIGCRTDFQIGQLPKLPQAVEVTLYRVCNEALSNVRTHSRAKNVHVHLEHTSPRINLVVEDDGLGFDAEDHMLYERVGGLLSMRRRVELMGGTLQVNSSPGGGTSIALQIPIDGAMYQKGQQAK